MDGIAFTAELIRENESRVILDLSGVDLIDSAGIGTIVLCFSRLKKAGGFIVNYRGKVNEFDQIAVVINSRSKCILIHGEANHVLRSFDRMTEAHAPEDPFPYILIHAATIDETMLNTCLAYPVALAQYIHSSAINRVVKTMAGRETPPWRKDSRFYRHIKEKAAS